MNMVPIFTMALVLKLAFFFQGQGYNEQIINIGSKGEPHSFRNWQSNLLNAWNKILVSFIPFHF